MWLSRLCSNCCCQIQTWTHIYIYQCCHFTKIYAHVVFLYFILEVIFWIQLWQEYLNPCKLCLLTDNLTSLCSGHYGSTDDVDHNQHTKYSQALNYSYYWSYGSSQRLWETFNWCWEISHMRLRYYKGGPVIFSIITRIDDQSDDDRYNSELLQRYYGLSFTAILWTIVELWSFTTSLLRDVMLCIW